MALLVLGLTIFCMVHLVSVLPTLRSSAVNKLGLLGFKAGFAVIALAGLVMVVIGLQQAPFVALWQPPAFMRHITMLLMLPAVILLMAAYVPNNLKRKVRHPMLMSVKVWATAHLLANGDLASMLLFTTFLAFAVVMMVRLNRRDPKPAIPAKARYWDALLIVVSLVVFGALAKHHQYFTGMPLF